MASKAAEVLFGGLELCLGISVNLPSNAQSDSNRPALDGLVVRVVAFGTEGRRFESTMIRRVPEAAGELEPRNRKPRYRACLHGDSVDSELASSPSDS